MRNNNNISLSYPLFKILPMQIANSLDDLGFNGQLKPQEMLHISMIYPINSCSHFLGGLATRASISDIITRTLPT